MSRRGSAVGNLLANFEKTISSNNAAGVTSGMYLSNMVAQKRRNSTCGSAFMSSKSPVSQPESHSQSCRSLSREERTARSRASLDTRLNLLVADKIHAAAAADADADASVVTAETSTSVTSNGTNASGNPKDSTHTNTEASRRRGRSLTPRSPGGQAVDLQPNASDDQGVKPTKKVIKVVVKKSPSEGKSNTSQNDATESPAKSIRSKSSSRLTSGSPSALKANDLKPSLVTAGKKSTPERKGESDVEQGKDVPYSKRSSSAPARPRSNSTEKRDSTEGSEENERPKAFKLAPSNKDNGSFRSSRKIPLSLDDDSEVEKPEPELEPETETDPTVPRKIKLRTASLGRKSLGRKRRIRHPSEVARES